MAEAEWRTRREAVMKFDEFLSRAHESVSARRVYAEPYEADGVTVIPAATVSGGGGGGGGQDGDGSEGGGGGFGLHGRPAGAYVIKDGKVQWVPAVDIQRIFFGVCAVAIAYLLGRGLTERTRLRSTRRVLAAQTAAQTADRVTTALLHRSASDRGGPGRIAAALPRLSAARRSRRGSEVATP